MNHRSAFEAMDADIEEHRLELIYELQGAAVLHKCDDPEDIHWPSYYFSNHFSIVSSGSPGATVCTSRNPAHLDYMTDHFPPRGKTGRVGESLVTPLSDDLDVVYQRGTSTLEEGFAYLVIFKRQKKVIVLTPQVFAESRYFPMRAVRTLIKVLLAEQGWTFLHSACFAARGHAVAVIGAKHSGKTTTLLNLLLGTGFRFMSNDRIAVKMLGGHLEAIGFPVAIGIRYHTCRALPQLLATLQRNPPGDYFRVDEYRSLFSLHSRQSQRPDGHESRLFLTPPELCRALRVGSTPSAPLAMFLVPTYSLSLREASAVRMEKTEASALAVGQLCAPVSEGQDLWLSLLRPAQAASQRKPAQVAETCVERLPFYLLSQNSETNEEAKELVVSLITELP